MLDDPYDSQSSLPVSPPALRRYRAERLLRKEFSGLRSKVLAIVRSQLRAKGVRLDPADLEACYAQAWHGLYATVLDGEEVENPSAWLMLVTFRRAIDESRSAGCTGVLEGEDRGSFSGRLDAHAPDLASELDDRARLRQVFEGMRATLSKRECEAASLCYLQGLSRAQAAERMGISEARMGKLMEGTGAGRTGVASKVGGLLDTIKAGGWCEQQGSLMRAYAFGILDPEGERYALAVAHTRECPACRAHVASLRGLASVLPLPLLPRLALSGAGGVGTTAGGAATRLVASGGRLRTRADWAWGGPGGPLTAKLAVLAVATVGTCYALFGSGAHGSPPARRIAAPSPFAGKALLQVPFPVRSRPVRSRRSSAPHARALHKAHSANEAAAREFGPERIQPERSSTQVPSSRTAHEFGFE
jgi:DNA-directed RNA polymerase specialized sigma24 family protein